MKSHGIEYKVMVLAGALVLVREDKALVIEVTLLENEAIVLEC